MEMLATQGAMLLYDGSFEGFLTVVFEATRLRLQVEGIEREEAFTPLLFAEPRLVPTETELAQRVWKGILTRGGADVAGLARGAFLAELPGGELKLWHYLRKLFADPSGYVARNVLDEHSHWVLATARKVSHEAHLLSGFARLSPSADGLMVGVVEPEYNVLELLAPHFVRRFPSMPWMLVDGKRGQALHYDTQELHSLSCDPVQVAQSLEKGGALQADLDPMGALWKSYYAAVNIPERQNKRLMARLLPRKYWKYLPERQD